MVDQERSRVGQVRFTGAHDGENGFVGDALGHMGVDRIGEIHTLQHLVAILQLAELATGQFHRDAFCGYLFNARDRSIQHPASVAFIAIGPADPFAFMHLDPLLVAELQPIELARGVNLYGLDAMLLPAHVDEIDFAVVEYTGNSIIALRKPKSIVAAANLEELCLPPIAGVSIFLTGELDGFPDIEGPARALQRPFRLQSVLNDLVCLRAAVAARWEQRRFIALLGRERQPRIRGVAYTIVGFDDAIAKDGDCTANIAGVSEIGDKPHFLGFLPHVDVDFADGKLVLDCAGLHEREALPRVDWIELLPVTDDGETADFHEVRDRGQLVHLLVRDHRTFVEDEIDSREFGLPGCERFRRPFPVQELLVPKYKGVRGHRLETGIGLEISDHLVLECEGLCVTFDVGRQQQRVFAFSAEHPCRGVDRFCFGDWLEHRRFTGARATLDKDDTIGR